MGDQGNFSHDQLNERDRLAALSQAAHLTSSPVSDQGGAAPRRMTSRLSSSFGTLSVKLV